MRKSGIAGARRLKRPDLSCGCCLTEAMGAPRTLIERIVLKPDATGLNDQAIALFGDPAMFISPVDEFEGGKYITYC
ncbi:hypothetical protein GCM10010909_04250 [Acidocella aquatica]|uniref:Uncharacterized protein n=1 Tax=Acidocella aquatica TaxID=1922313 RepID=A0ABQ6A287_9PROT|nr:hypothetical protein [Acidocella aquatica]GLR65747.1 hypothetical protein GCM10010909_04250 [Acidocella aquatica]